MIETYMHEKVRAKSGQTDTRYVVPYLCLYSVFETSFSPIFSHEKSLFFHTHFKHISYKCPFPFPKGDLHTIEGTNKK
jgi:hypothetical protein